APDHPKSGLLRILSDESRRLNSVLTRFLAFARPAAGERQSFELVTEVQSVLELARQETESPALVLDLPDQLDSRLEGDREQIRQLLLNLVLNAVAAAGRDGQVTVRLAAATHVVTCRVTDDGPGFSAEARENFGAPFFSTREGGTGLGLAICLRIVEDHRGQIVLEPAADRGATVRVDLPRVRGGNATPRRADSAPGEVS
ncbi:MAG: ATP-binding protein, partial [bacterium]